MSSQEQQRVSFVDASPPEHVCYMLPEIASCKDADELVLAMDEIESHLSRCRFQLFLEQVVEAWPQELNSIEVCMIQDDTFSNGHPFKWRGSALGHANEEGHRPILRQEISRFWDLLHNAAYPEDSGFVLLAQTHFGSRDRGCSTIDKERARAMIMDVIPERRRAKMLKHRMDQSVPAASPDAEPKAGPRL